MNPLKFYAYGSFVICVMSVVCDIYGIGRNGAVRHAFDFITLMEGAQLFWICVSVAACGFFLCIKAPIKAPAVYSLYSIFTFVVTVAIFASGGSSQINAIPTGLYVMDVGMSLFLLKLNWDLLEFSRKSCAGIKPKQESI